VLTTRPHRLEALGPVLAECAFDVVVGGEALPLLHPYDAIVLDGAPVPRDAVELEAIAARVGAGASLVAIGAAPREADGFWADLLGATAAGDVFPSTEWFAKAADGPSDLTTRVDDEFALVDAVEPLHPAPGTTTTLAVSRGYRDCAVLVERVVGAGRVVTSGLGVSDAGLRSTALTTILRRALRPAAGTPSEAAIGMAVVGYGPFGGMGYLHGTAAAETPGLELVAVVDTSAERRKAAEDDFPGVRAYSSVTELCEDGDVRLVVVATPPAHHAALSLQLLRAGKHVACEKPLCLTVAEADELIAAAAQNERVLTVHQNRRWDPDFLALRRAVEAGMLGDLFNVETFVGGYEHPCRAWHSEVSVSGGAVYDWGSHHVDWILQLFGSAPATVQTIGHKRVWHDVTNLDQLRVRMAWDDGREAEFFQSDVAAVRRPKFYVQGTAGTLVGHYRPVAFERVEPGRGYVRELAHHAEAPADLLLARYEPGYGITETALPVATPPRHPFHANLADHLHLGEPLAVTPESVRRVIAVLEASQRSSDDGGTTITL
jgi:predicted dehydrogenase